MEEKERYEFLDGSKFASKYGLDVWDDYEDSVFDRINKEIISTEDIVNLLNQQDKRIKESDAEKKFWHSTYQGIQLDYDKLNNDYNKQEKLLSEVLADRSKMQLELDQLKQQLHDLPKKIVGEIIDIAGDYWDFNICEECGNVPDLNTLTIKDFEEILDTILKKYGGENESDND